MRGSKPAARHAARAARRRGHHPRLVRERGEVDRRAARQRVLGGQERVHGLLGEIGAVQPVVLAARDRRVLEADRRVQAAGCDAPASASTRPSSTASSSCGSCPRSAASAAGTIVASALGTAPSRSVARSPADVLGDLAVGEREPGRERLGVLEEELAGRGRGRSRAPAHEQRRPELALQREQPAARRPAGCGRARPPPARTIPGGRPRGR